MLWLASLLLMVSPVHAQDADSAATQPADAAVMMVGQPVTQSEITADPAAETGDDTDGPLRDRDRDADRGENPDRPRTAAVSFRNAEMSQVARFLMDELNKPVIVDDRVGETRITIMSDDEMPVAQAFELIGNALRQKGVLIVESARQIDLLPLDQMRRINRPVIGDDESVADLPDQSTIVDKEFAVEHYDVTRLKDMVLAMLPEYAFLVADPNLNRMVVTAAAADLAHIERLVAELDVPRANQTVERIIPVENGDASEIVALVRTLIAATLGIEAQDVFTSPRPDVRNTNNRGGNNRNNRGGGNQRGGSSTTPPEQALFIERSEAPILLQADLSRNWIIAAAPPQVMDEIERWVEELDKPRDQDEPYELFDITHADVEEIAGQLNETISSMPDREMSSSLRVIPFTKSRQLLVYGSQRGRALVRSLLDQLDVESSQYRLIREIKLDHDDAENVKAKIEELFSGGGASGGSGNRYYFFGRGSQSSQEDELTVTADTQRNTVTIMTDPQRMQRIETIIEEQWDVPLDLDAVKPKVYSLDYVDPVQVKTLLEDMFTKSSTTSSFSFRSFSSQSETSTPVGRLFGEFSFVAMQDSNKLIVSTKNPANYQVIDDLLEEIDVPQDSGVPVVIELKHANAEEVAEQLNAMFSEPGTPANITRTERGLSDAIRDSSTSSDRGASTTTNQNANNANRNPNSGNTTNNNTDPGQLSFWWSQSRPNLTEQPTSNLIGKPRVVPVNRRNALMVLAPRAHIGPMRELITDLDKPGAQVAIHAIITEIQHNDESTLGVRLASDPSIFNDSRLADQAIGGGINANYAESIFRGDGILNANLNVNVLIQLLIRNLNLKVLNEPRVYTADNQEAHFFDGQDVPVIISDFSGGGNNDNVNLRRTFDYEPVGTRLHVRPHITQEGEVDLEINLELSRIVNGSSVFGNFIFDRRETTTHVTVLDGQTIVISGIVQQEDFDEVRKLPILGDIPLIGFLFRSTDRAVRNREIIAFITPHVVRNVNQHGEIDRRNKEWLERVRDTFEPLDVEDSPDRLLTDPALRERQERFEEDEIEGPVADPAGP